MPRERLGADLRSGTVHEIHGDFDETTGTAWSLSLIAVKRSLRLPRRPEGTYDHWLGLSGPQLELISNGRAHRLGADQQVVIENGPSVELLRGGYGRTKDTRALRATRDPAGAPLNLDRLWVHETILLPSNVRAVFVVQGRIELVSTRVDAGSSVILDVDEDARSVRGHGVIATVTLGPPVLPDRSVLSSPVLPLSQSPDL